MIILRYRTTSALVLFGAVAFLMAACDADEAKPTGGDEARSGVDALADATVSPDQFKESEIEAPVDASTDLAVVADPDQASPPELEPVQEIVVPGPPNLQTATFALG